MGYFEIGFVVLIAVVLGIVAATTVIAMAANSTVAARVRSTLRTRLGRTRLFRMLQRRNVDVDAYLQETRVPELQKQIATCEACPGSTKCDSALEGPDGSDFAFCPNNPAIEDARRALGDTEDPTVEHTRPAEGARPA